MLERSPRDAVIIAAPTALPAWRPMLFFLCVGLTMTGLIWLAGVVFLIGSLIALWPSAAEQRRLAERYRELRGLARA